MPARLGKAAMKGKACDVVVVTCSKGEPFVQRETIVPTQAAGEQPALLHVVGIGTGKQVSVALLVTFPVPGLVHNPGLKYCRLSICSPIYDVRGSRCVGVPQPEVAGGQIGRALLLRPAEEAGPSKQGKYKPRRYY